MQGELSEIDLRSILQLVELGQRTGQLLVETGGRCWFVFFMNGQIVYAGDPEAGLGRLRSHLQRYGSTAALSESGSESGRSNAPEYGQLWALIEQRALTPEQAREVLQSMVHETLFELLGVHQGHFMFELGAPLTPQLMTLEIAPLVALVAKQIQEWKSFYPQLQSPDQCPIVTNPEALGQALPANTVTTLLHYANGQTSLRQIAHSLNRDILTVARAIYPCIQRGWLQLAPPDRPGTRSGQSAAGPGRLEAWQTSGPASSWPQTPVQALPQIVCIDDAATVRHSVAAMLEAVGFQVTGIEDPVQALSQVFQIRPQLILCDIAMPVLDGYEVCAMLRQSTTFRPVPIIMLTGKDGFIDRVRAQMVGATDYLAKPFGAEELVMLVEKYLGPGYTEWIEAHTLLGDAASENSALGDSASEDPAFGDAALGDTNWHADRPEAIGPPGGR
jgi:twitching motility two-component system response regulator PilG